jgi:OFA family oxalate/formate antiporter-like MFS transporter
MNSAAPERGLFYGWIIAAAAALGIACSFSVLVTTITSLFAAPLSREMGWTTPQIMLGPLVAGSCGLATAPLIGALSDRFGARRIVLLSFLIEVCVVASFHNLDSWLPGYWLRYGALALLCMGTTQVAFSRIISSWFNRRLGLALGIALAGVGVGGFGWSWLVQQLIDLYGWRNAYLGVAGIIACLTIPALFLLLRETPATLGLGVDGQPGTAAVPGAVVAGMSLRQAIVSPQYRLMALTFFLFGLSLQGAQLNLIPMLTSRGVSAQVAAHTQAIMLLTLIFGRVSSGFLLDRFFAPRVSQAFLLAPIAGIAALALGATGWPALVSAMGIGLAVGGESDVIAYLVRRYFGLREYSRIYGTFFSFFGAGASLGPFATSWGVAHTSGGYGSVLWVHIALLIVTVALLSAFQSYRRE